MAYRELLRFCSKEKIKEKEKASNKPKFGGSIMEVHVDIDEQTVCLLKSYTERDVSSIVTEALNKWIKQNILVCPVNGKYCVSREPCNSCQHINRK